MDLYSKTAYKQSQLLTNAYSTSFSMSMRLFDKALRHHIYAIYGLVRIADEIVDTYEGTDQRELLDVLERETHAAIKRGYSVNPIVHSYALTARRYAIPADLLKAFFKSMRMDLTSITYTQETYTTYIHGSAEAVGLMCLKIFTDDSDLYDKLKDGASRLGAGYQKVNFLRDLYADAVKLNRWYFPFGSYEAFDEKAKQRIIKDIQKDFDAGQRAAYNLPPTSRRAVLLSLTYYQTLLDQLAKTPAETLKHSRIRISDTRKIMLLIKAGGKRNVS